MLSYLAIFVLQARPMFHKVCPIYLINNHRLYLELYIGQQISTMHAWRRILGTKQLSRVSFYLRKFPRSLRFAWVIFFLPFFPVPYGMCPVIRMQFVKTLCLHVINRYGSFASWIGPTLQAVQRYRLLLPILYYLQHDLSNHKLNDKDTLGLYMKYCEPENFSEYCWTSSIIPPYTSSSPLKAPPIICFVKLVYAVEVEL